MIASLKRIGALIVKELHQVVRDPGNVGIAVILPAVLLLLFGYGMSMDIKNVRIAYLAVPASSQSTDLETRLTLSRYFQTTRVFSTREAEEKLRTHEADAFIALQSNAPDTLHNGTTLAEGSPDDIRKHAPPREDGAPASLEDAFLTITEEHMKKGGET